MAELVDALDSKSSFLRSAGSSPARGTSGIWAHAPGGHVLLAWRNWLAFCAALWERCG
ncbi:hypothetical protein ERY430_70136 [Erythrobacter sp. EC-HK427]|nr:hypothetical protein ERY430_70136 [Erythrobacter sp. EC-HK427]